MDVELRTFVGNIRDLGELTPAHPLILLRLDGDGPDLNSWHLVDDIQLDRETAGVTVTFADGTEPKIYDGVEFVDFAVPPPLSE